MPTLLGNFAEVKESEVGYINLKDCPWWTCSGVYPATIVNATAGTKTVKGDVRQTIDLAILVKGENEQGQARVNVELPPSQYRQTCLELMIVLGFYNQQGPFLPDTKEVQLEKPLQDGRTSITHYPDLEGKDVLVALRYTGKSEQTGRPFLNAMAFFRSDGFSAYELINRATAPVAIERIKTSLPSENTPLFKEEKKPAQTYGRQQPAAQPAAQPVKQAAPMQQPQPQPANNGGSAYGQNTGTYGQFGGYGQGGYNPYGR